MDLKQLEYILKIAEESSITKAAEKLFITQPALNQQLLKLEREFGLQLFYRSKTDFRLTPAGRVYIDYARQILDLKKEAYTIISDIAHDQRGTLSVGLTPERGIQMFMEIYPAFYKLYPNVTIYPQEINVRKQQEMITHNYLDIGFITLPEHLKTSDEYLEILEENLLLAVNRENPLSAYAGELGSPIKEIDLSLFQDEIFVLMFKESTMRTVIDPIFEQAGFKPRILFETSSNQTLYSTVANNISCSVLPSHYADLTSKQVAYFHLPSRPSWKLMASYKKGRYLGKAAMDFIHLARKYWHQTEENHVKNHIANAPEYM